MSVNTNKISKMGSEDESLKKLIKEQNDLLIKIYEQSEKTRKYILMGRIISLVYVLLIIAPIIFAVIYLPPLLEQILSPYQSLLNTSGSVDLNGVDASTINNLFKGLK